MRCSVTSGEARWSALGLNGLGVGLLVELVLLPSEVPSSLPSCPDS